MGRYFDYAATTPLDPRVLQKMLPYFTEQYGNPSSIYSFAAQARQAVEDAREKVAKFLECKSKEIIFAGSGTESCNLAVLGIAEKYAEHGKHIIVSNIEHDAVMQPLAHLQALGFEVTYLPVGQCGKNFEETAEGEGIISVDAAVRALRPDTILVSVMHANNEIGTIQPIEKIGKAISDFRKKMGREGHGKNSFPFFHTDACQSAPFLPLDVNELGVDLLSLNGSKVYGPKGVGVLYKKEGVLLTPRTFGGGQEFGFRSGTENVAAIVGLAEALLFVERERRKENKRLVALRDFLMEGLLAKIPRARLNGDRIHCLPNNVNISFAGLEGEAILLKCDETGMFVSSGSACTSRSLEPSHVVRALGLPDEWTHSSVRFSLGKENTHEDIEYVLEKLPPIIQELREASPF